MNCKICGSSTTEKQTNAGIAFECNQDNGECLNERGYPTSSWAQQLPPRNGAQRGARRPAAAPVAARPAAGNAAALENERIKWQTCLKVAGSIQGVKNAVDVLKIARELFAAKPVAPAPRPAPAPEPIEDEDTTEAAIF